MAVKKYLDFQGLTTYNNKLKTVYPVNIAYGSYTPTGESDSRIGIHLDLDVESGGTQSPHTYTVVDLGQLYEDFVDSSYFYNFADILVDYIVDLDLTAFDSSKYGTCAVTRDSGAVSPIYTVTALGFNEKNGNILVVKVGSESGGTVSLDAGAQFRVKYGADSGDVYSVKPIKYHGANLSADIVCADDIATFIYVDDGLNPYYSLINVDCGMVRERFNDAVFTLQPNNCTIGVQFADEHGQPQITFYTDDGNYTHTSTLAIGADETYILDSACEKDVSTSISYGSTLENYVPTTKAVSDFVDKTDFIERVGSIYIASTPAAVNSTITITNDTYKPRKGGTIVVKFTYDVLAGTSLKIGSSNTAYPIYLNGSAIESGVITAGTTVTMVFTGSAYEITAVPITNSTIDSLFTT